MDFPIYFLQKKVYSVYDATDLQFMLIITSIERNKCLYHSECLAAFLSYDLVPLTDPWAVHCWICWNSFFKSGHKFNCWTLPFHYAVNSIIIYYDMIMCDCKKWMLVYITFWMLLYGTDCFVTERLCSLHSWHFFDYTISIKDVCNAEVHC